MPPEQVLIFIVGTVVILFGAYYVTYYIGMKASGQTRAGMRNRNITMRDRYSVARDKSFCIIEIAGKVYVVGMTNHTMTLLDTLDAADFAKLTKNNPNTSQSAWGQTPVGQYGNKLTKKVVAFFAEKLGKGSPDGVDNEYSTDSSFSNSMKEAERKADGLSETDNTEDN